MVEFYIFDKKAFLWGSTNLFSTKNFSDDQKYVGCH